MGTKIKDGAKKLWNKAKPHIMKGVNQVKDKVVDAGKKLLKKGEEKAKEMAEKVAADLGKKVQEKAEEVSKTVNSHVERLSGRPDSPSFSSWTRTACRSFWS